MATGDGTLTNMALNASTMNHSSHAGITVYDLYGYYNVIIVATLLSTIAFIGLTGNMLVFFAVGLSRKLHNVTNAFIVSLAISDFLSCFMLPFQIIAVVSDDWPLPHWVCSVVGSLGIVTQSCGILTLAVISLNRYILITKPRKLYLRTYTNRKVAAMILFTWLFPFLFLLVPQICLGGLGYQDFFKVCLWNSRHKLALIFQGIGALAFVVSTVLIIFSYISIYVFVRRHMRIMAAKEGGNDGNHDNNASTEIAEEESRANGTRVDNPASGASTKQKAISRKQIEITKNLCLVVVTFFICVLPYTIHLPTGIYDMRGTYFAIILFSHACINPILYAAKHPHFKIVFRCMFRCRFTDIPLPTMWLKKTLDATSSMYANGMSSTDGKFA